MERDLVGLVKRYGELNEQATLYCSSAVYAAPTRRINLLVLALDAATRATELAFAIVRLGGSVDGLAIKSRGNRTRTKKVRKQ